MKLAEADIISSTLQKHEFPNHSGCGRENENHKYPDLLNYRPIQSRILIQIGNNNKYESVRCHKHDTEQVGVAATVQCTWFESRLGSRLS
jgi:hypothetical protein